VPRPGEFAVDATLPVCQERPDCGVAAAGQRTYCDVRNAFGIGVVAGLVLGAAIPAHAQVAYGPGAIVARVRDAASRPLAGALVEAVGPTTRSATSNGAGIVALVGLPAGWYDVSVSLSGYATFEQRLAVGPTTSAPQVIAPTLQLASLANPVTAATRALPGLGGSLEPFAASAVAADRDTNVVAAGGGAAVSVDGTLPYESRVELDGIPIAGGAGSPAVLRFRDGLGLAGIDVSGGPDLGSPVARDAIGGIVNFRTPAIDSVQTLGLDQGYDSAFGSFSHARAVHDFGNVALAFDAVTGGGADRSDSFKARYAFSSAASIDVASYDLAGTGTVGNANVAASAPAFEAGLRFALGGGTFQARSFRSSLQEVAGIGSAAAPNERARASGVQLGYDLPLGADRVSFAFDRRSETTAYENEPANEQTFSSLSARANITLARAVRLDLADVYSGGTLVRARNDPQTQLSYRIGSKVTLRLASGAAFATAPESLLALRNASSPALAPETAYGERLSAEGRLNATDSVRLSVYDDRRFDTFGPFANAASRGAGLGFERARPRGLGAIAYFALDRSYAYGSAQPFFRNAESYGTFAGEQLSEEPYAKARAGLTYRTSATCESRIGTTFYGANNAFATTGVAIGDASLCFVLLGFVDVRAGEHNLFGAAVRDPVLAPLLTPHEYTLSIGLH
jgi:hypothetical protein